MTSASSILRGIWSDDLDSSSQLLCLHELNHALALGHGNNVRSASYVPALAKLLKKAGTSFDATLLAIRALNNILDLQPLCGDVIVAFDILPVLCDKLNNLQDLDLARQALKCLELLSKTCPEAVVRAGGLKCLIAFIDFFPSNLQLKSITALVALCSSVTKPTVQYNLNTNNTATEQSNNPIVETAPFVLEALPHIKERLKSPDNKIIQQALCCIKQLVEGYAVYKHKEDSTATNGSSADCGKEVQDEMIRQVMTEDCVKSVLRIIDKGDVIDQKLTFELLLAFSRAVEVSPEIAETLLEHNILQHLRNHLSSCIAHLQTQHKSNFKDLGSQINQALKLCVALCSVVPKDADFYDDSVTQSVVLCSIKKTKKRKLDTLEQVKQTIQVEETKKAPEKWSCPACTFLNVSSAGACEVCGQLCPQMKAKATKHNTTVETVQALVEKRKLRKTKTLEELHKARPEWMTEFYESLFDIVTDILLLSGDPTCETDCITITTIMLCHVSNTTIDQIFASKAEKMSLLRCCIYSKNTGVINAMLKLLMVQTWRLGSETLSRVLNREGVLDRVKYILDAAKKRIDSANSQQSTIQENAKLAENIVSRCEYLLSKYKVTCPHDNPTIIKLKEFARSLSPAKAVEPKPKSRAKKKRKTKHTDTQDSSTATGIQYKTRQLNELENIFSQGGVTGFELLSSRLLDTLLPGVGLDEFKQLLTDAFSKQLATTLTQLIYICPSLEVLQFGPANTPSSLAKLGKALYCMISPSESSQQLFKNIHNLKSKSIKNPTDEANINNLDQKEEQGCVVLKAECLAQVNDVKRLVWNRIKDWVKKQHQRVQHREHKTKHSQPEIKVGTLVLRGPHWRWGNQDQPTLPTSKAKSKSRAKRNNKASNNNETKEQPIIQQNAGVVVELVQWQRGFVEGGMGVRVRWTGNSHVRTYRYGAEGAYDVVVWKPNSRRQSAVTPLPKTSQLWRENLKPKDKVEFLTQQLTWTPATVAKHQPGTNLLSIEATSPPIPSKTKQGNRVSKDKIQHCGIWVSNASERVAPVGSRISRLSHYKDSSGHQILKQDLEKLEIELRQEKEHMQEVKVAWAQSLQKGDRVEAQDDEDKWVCGIVLDTVHNERVLIHFESCPCYKNVWRSVNSDSIAPLYTNTDGSTPTQQDSSWIPHTLKSLASFLFMDAEVIRPPQQKIHHSKQRAKSESTIVCGSAAFLCIKVLNKPLYIPVIVHELGGNERSDRVVVSYNNGAIYRDDVAMSDLSVEVSCGVEDVDCILKESVLAGLLEKHGLTMVELAEQYSTVVMDDVEEDQSDQFEDEEELAELGGRLREAVSLAHQKFQEAQNRSEYNEMSQTDSDSESEEPFSAPLVQRSSNSRYNSTDSQTLRSLSSRLFQALSQSTTQNSSSTTTSQLQNTSSSAIRSILNLGAGQEGGGRSSEMDRLYAREALTLLEQQRNSLTQQSSTENDVPIVLTSNGLLLEDSYTITEVATKIRETEDSALQWDGEENWPSYLWSKPHSLQYNIDTTHKEWKALTESLSQVGSIISIDGAFTYTTAKQNTAEKNTIQKDKIQPGTMRVKTHFPTVSVGGVWLKKGCHYFELEVVKAGLAQIGWADPYFKPQDTKGLGCGDDIHSWAFDGLRVKKWNSESDNWGKRWKVGDVVGCAIDIQQNSITIQYSINGIWNYPMGVAYEKVPFQGNAVRPVLTFNSSFSGRILLGDSAGALSQKEENALRLYPVRHAPPNASYQTLSKFIVRERARRNRTAMFGKNANTIQYNMLPTLRSKKKFGLPSVWSSIFTVLEIVQQPDTIQYSRLGQWMVRQLKDPVVLCTGCIPQWLFEVSRQFRYLMSFELRFRLFELSSFGVVNTIRRMFDQQYVRNVVSSGVLQPEVVLQRKQKALVLRHKVLKSAMVLMEKPSSQKAILTVQFSGESGHGLGPTLEFYSLVCRELQRKNLGIWLDHSTPTKPTSQQSTAPATQEYVVSKGGLFPCRIKNKKMKKLQYFRLMGRFLAKAFYDERLLDLPLSVVLCKLLVKNKVTVEDVKEVDEPLGNSLMKLQQISDGAKSLWRRICSAKDSKTKKELTAQYNTVQQLIESMCLDFTFPGKADLELVKNGAKINVTVHNLAKYVDCVVTQILTKDSALQVEEMRRGINELFPCESLELLSATELYSILCSGAQNKKWDKSDITRNIVCNHGYKLTDSVIVNLIDVLSEFDAQQQKLFLKFSTGCPRLPIGGWDQLNPKLTIVKKESSNGDDTDRVLPSCSTCQVYLKLPPYSNKHILKQQLVYAIQEGQDFFALD